PWSCDLNDPGRRHRILEFPVRQGWRIGWRIVGARNCCGFIAAFCLVCLTGCPENGRTITATDADASSHDVATDTTVSSAGLTLKSITPRRGSLAGGEQFAWQGAGFGADAKVWFGGVPVPIAFFGGATHLYVNAPPASSAGFVDVKIQSGFLPKGGV